MEFALRGPDVSGSPSTVLVGSFPARRALDLCRLGGHRGPSHALRLVGADWGSGSPDLRSLFPRRNRCIQVNEISEAQSPWIIVARYFGARNGNLLAPPDSEGGLDLLLALGDRGTAIP